jgi:hypothetical protein
LEQNWLANLRATKRQPGGAPAMLASNTTTGAPEAQLAQRIVVRQTAPPVQPFDPAPGATFRGVSAEEPVESGRYTAGGQRAPVGTPAYPSPTAVLPAADGWQPVPQQGQPPQVTLGTPPELQTPPGPAWPQR